MQTLIFSFLSIFLTVLSGDEMVRRQTHSHLPKDIKKNRIDKDSVSVEKTKGRKSQKQTQSYHSKHKLTSQVGIRDENNNLGGEEERD